LSTKKRDNAPHTPRIVLLGPPGSGKSEQASLISNKYDLVHGKCDHDSEKNESSFVASFITKDGAY